MSTLDIFLYWYTLIFSVALIISALSSGLNLGNLTTLAFFLPVPTFLLLQTLKRYYLWKQSLPPSPNPTSPIPNPLPLKSIFTPTHPLHLFTLILFIAAILISLIKAIANL